MPQSRKTHGYEAIISGENRSPDAAAIRLLARVASPIYAAATRLRNLAFDLGLRPVAKPHCPVISIGNLTTGGTGKSPMVAHTVETLADSDHHPAVVMRGYKASPDAGSDEATELDETFARADLPAIPVITDPDRVAALRRIDDELPDVDVVVLDDGFQHRRLGRTLDIVLIDATNPFGYGHVLPRGLMREHPAALARADAVVVTRSDRVPDHERQRIDEMIETYHGGRPLAHAIHQWEAFLDHRDQRIDPSDCKVLAVCGIGNPRAFFDQAEETVILAATRAYGDHHDFTEADLNDIFQTADRLDAEAVLVTEKDWVKLRRRLNSSDPPTPVWRPRLSIGFLDGGKQLRKLILDAAGKSQDS